MNCLNLYEEQPYRAIFDLVFVVGYCKISPHDLELREGVQLSGDDFNSALLIYIIGLYDFPI